MAKKTAPAESLEERIARLQSELDKAKREEEEVKFQAIAQWLDQLEGLDFTMEDIERVAKGRGYAIAYVGVASEETKRAIIKAMGDAKSISVKREEMDKLIEATGADEADLQATIKKYFVPVEGQTGRPWNYQPT